MEVRRLTDVSTQKRLTALARGLLESPWVLESLLGCLAFAVAIVSISAHRLTGAYDSGFYFATSFKLASGIFPYKTFLFVQPPGTVLWILPAAVVGKIAGAATGFLVARVESAVFVAMTIGLIARILRPLGYGLMVLAAGYLAVSPCVVEVATEIRTEPYFIFLTLLGVFMLGRKPVEELTSRDLYLSGIFFGLAVSTKLWAVVPAALALIVFGVAIRTRAWRILLGAAASATAACLPFLIAGGSNFYRDVVTLQLDRLGHRQYNVATRFSYLTGLELRQLMPSQILSVVIAALVVATLSARFFSKNVSRMERFIILTTIADATFVIVTVQFYRYYPYFVLPFLVMAIAMSLRAIGEYATRNIYVRRWAPRAQLTVLALAIITVGGIWSVERPLLKSTGNYSAFVDSVIPANSCVLFRSEYVGIEANRVTSNQPTCPSIVDVSDTYLDESLKALSRQGQTPIALHWEAMLARAQYVVLPSPNSVVDSLTRGVHQWFEAHFSLVASIKHVYIYRYH